jgi:2-iminobutanoate/2-iminopropanoate deaminase
MPRFHVLLALLSTAILSAAPAGAAPVVRHKGAADAIILQAVTVPPGSETLILSGQLASPIDPSRPATTMADFGDTRTQTISTFKRIAAILTARGYTMGDVVKLTVFVAGDPKLGGKMDFAGFNDGYKQFFGTAEQPNLVARSTVQVAALAGPNFLIEIEATAVKAPK